MNKLENKCIAAGCKSDTVVTLKTLWGDQREIHFCSVHTPTFTKSLKVGDKTRFYEIISK